MKPSAGQWIVSTRYHYILGHTELVVKLMLIGLLSELLTSSNGQLHCSDY